MLCHGILWNVTVCYAIPCCAVRITDFPLYSLFFRVRDDTKVLSSGLPEEKGNVSAVLNSQNTRSSRGTPSLFYSFTGYTVTDTPGNLEEGFSSANFLQEAACSCIDGCCTAHDCLPLNLPSMSFHGGHALSPFPRLLGGGSSSLKIYMKITVDLSCFCLRIWCGSCTFSVYGLYNM